MQHQFKIGDTVYYYFKTDDTKPTAQTQVIEVLKTSQRILVRLKGFDDLVPAAHIKPFYPLIKVSK